MATGVFNAARTGHNLRSRKSRTSHAPIDALADALAEDPDGSVTRAASKIGLTTANAYRLFARIRKELGPQAN